MISGANVRDRGPRTRKRSNAARVRRSKCGIDVDALTRLERTEVDVERAAIDGVPEAWDCRRHVIVGTVDVQQPSLAVRARGSGSVVARQHAQLGAARLPRRANVEL